MKRATKLHKIVVVFGSYMVDLQRTGSKAEFNNLGIYLFVHFGMKYDAETN